MKSPQRLKLQTGWHGLCSLLVSAGLAGCGDGDGGAGFQEYSQLAASPRGTAAGTPSGVAPCGSDRPLKYPSDSNDAPPVLAFVPAPVRAPLPEEVLLAGRRTPADVALSRDGLLAVVAAPVPAALQSGGTSASSDVAAAVEPTAVEPTAAREIKVLVEDRKFNVEGPEQAIRVSFDDIDLLKVINMDPVTEDAPDYMPAWQKQLHGKRIRIRGYMYPAFMDTGITSFLVARDTQKCCFGTEAKLYDRFLVRLRKGVTTDYLLRRPFDVVGVFHIDPVMLDGELFQLYQIDDAVVIEK